MKLIQLITSLTAGEKRFFNLLNSKKDNGDVSKTMNLFNAIQNNEETANKPLTNPTKELARTKYRLNQLIEQSLVFHSSGFYNFQPDALDLLRLSKVFYKKNLYSQSLKSVNKGLIIAREEEDLSLLLSFLDLKEKISYRKSNILDLPLEQQIKKINEERSHCINKIAQISQLKALHSKIAVLLVQRVEVENETIQTKKEEIRNEINTLDPIFLSVKGQIIYLKVKQLYCFLINDMDEGINVTQSIIDTFNEHFSSNFFFVEDYLRIYQNLISIQLSKGDLNAVQLNLTKLSNIVVSPKNKSLVKFKQAMICYSEISLFHKRIEFAQVLTKINNLRNLFPERYLQYKSIIELSFLEILSNFVLKNYSTADNQIRNYLISNSKNSLKTNRASTLILNILIQWELGVLGVIPSLCDASKYYFKSIASYKESDRIIISWLKSTLSKKMDKTTFKDKLVLLKDKLETQQLEYSLIFEQIYFSCWVNSKLNQVDLLDVLKSKAVFSLKQKRPPHCEAAAS